MAFVYFNPNPLKKLVGDCVVRGISKLTDQDWKTVYIELCVQSFSMYDMPSSNAVWGALLYKKGYRNHVIPDTCPNCYSVRQFCLENPNGKYLLATGSHVVAVKDGELTPIGLAIATEGEARPSSLAVFTPQAVDELGNVTATALVTVPKGCCFSASVRYVDATSLDPATEPTPVINVQNANLVITRVA